MAGAHPVGPEDAFWGELRGLYPALERLTYLNNASIQPLPRPVAEALHGFVATACEQDPDSLHTPEVYSKLRRTFALWLGCSAADLAFTSSTSDGLIKAVNAVPWRPGDEVILPHNEFPSVTYPLEMARREGAAVRMAGAPGRPVTEEEVLAAVTPRTRAAAFSWVSFSTGYRMDLRALASSLKERGVEYVIVDGMQGAGVWDPRLSETEVDFFSFQAVKWIAGPNGIGALYVRPGLWEKIRNRSLSWFSVPCCEDYSLLTERGLPPFAEARQMDGGTPVTIAVVGVQAYLDLLAPAGVEGISARVAWLMERLAETLEAHRIPTLLPLRRSPPSAIALLEVADSAGAHRRLREAGIATSIRMGRIRVSPHAYNAPEDFARLARVLEEGR
jgi:cysteine desulfurase/selenocysteine lyase